MSREGRKRMKVYETRYEGTYDDEAWTGLWDDL